jgi:16S rRNA (guanine(966)-N(2))-methyltransferase RsmD
MRIIGGYLKSRKLCFPKSRITRPVTDRAKETIFNVLGNLTQSVTVLDLFAGSGSLGIEALSRGARSACFVDSDRQACKCIDRNLKSLELLTLSSTCCTKVDLAVRRLQKEGQKFDLIFLDPPHNKGLIKKVLRLIDRSDIVSSFGTIIVGHSNREALPNELITLRHQRSIKIGQSFVSFLNPFE